MTSEISQTTVEEAPLTELKSEPENTTSTPAGADSLLAKTSDEPQPAETEQDDFDVEEDDEEEALLVSMELEKEKEDAEEAAHPHPQPKDIHSAPKLLQDALKTGSVQDDESGVTKAKATRPVEPNEGAAVAKAVDDSSEEKKTEELDADLPPTPSYKARVSLISL
jgi:hypothetical protein